MTGATCGFSDLDLLPRAQIDSAQNAGSDQVVVHVLIVRVESTTSRPSCAPVLCARPRTGGGALRAFAQLRAVPAMSRWFLVQADLNPASTRQVRASRSGRSLPRSATEIVCPDTFAFMGLDPVAELRLEARAHTQSESGRRRRGIYRRTARTSLRTSMPLSTRWMPPSSTGLMWAASRNRLDS